MERSWGTSVGDGKAAEDSSGVQPAATAAGFVAGDFPSLAGSRTPAKAKAASKWGRPTPAAKAVAQPQPEVSEAVVAEESAAEPEAPAVEAVEQPLSAASEVRAAEEQPKEEEETADVQPKEEDERDAAENQECGQSSVQPPEIVSEQEQASVDLEPTLQAEADTSSQTQEPLVTSAPSTEQPEEEEEAEAPKVSETDFPSLGGGPSARATGKPRGAWGAKGKPRLQPAAQAAPAPATRSVAKSPEPAQATPANSAPVAEGTEGTEGAGDSQDLSAAAGNAVEATDATAVVDEALEGAVSATPLKCTEPETVASEEVEASAEDAAIAEEETPQAEAHEQEVEEATADSSVQAQETPAAAEPPALTPARDSPAPSAPEPPAAAEPQAPAPGRWQTLAPASAEESAKVDLTAFPSLGGGSSRPSRPVPKSRGAWGAKGKQTQAAPVAEPVAPAPAPVEVPTGAKDKQPQAAPAAEPVAPAPAPVKVPTEVPASEAPASEAPASEAPASEAPASEAPASEVPASEAQTPEAPAPEAPAPAQAMPQEVAGNSSELSSEPAAEGPGAAAEEQVEPRPEQPAEDKAVERGPREEKEIKPIFTEDLFPGLASSRGPIRSSAWPAAGKPAAKRVAAAPKLGKWAKPPSLTEKGRTTAAEAPEAAAAEPAAPAEEAPAEAAEPALAEAAADEEVSAASPPTADPQEAEVGATEASTADTDAAEIEEEKAPEDVAIPDTAVVPEAVTAPDMAAAPVAVEATESPVVQEPPAPTRELPRRAALLGKWAKPLQVMAPRVEDPAPRERSLAVEPAKAVEAAPAVEAVPADVAPAAAVEEAEVAVEATEPAEEEGKALESGAETTALAAAAAFAEPPEGPASAATAAATSAITAEATAACQEASEPSPAAEPKQAAPALPEARGEWPRRVSLGKWAKPPNLRASQPKAGPAPAPKPAVPAPAAEVGPLPAAVVEISTAASDALEPAEKATEEAPAAAPPSPAVEAAAQPEPVASVEGPVDPASSAEEPAEEHAEAAPEPTQAQEEEAPPAIAGEVLAAEVRAEPEASTAEEPERPAAERPRRTVTIAAEASPAVEAPEAPRRAQLGKWATPLRMRPEPEEAPAAKAVQEAPAAKAVQEAPAAKAVQEAPAAEEAVAAAEPEQAEAEVAEEVEEAEEEAEEAPGAEEDITSPGLAARPSPIEDPDDELEEVEDEEGEQEEDEAEEAEDEQPEAAEPSAAAASSSAAAAEPKEASLEHASDRGLEDLETADSSGIGLKGETEHTDEERSDEAGSSFGSVPSPEDRTANESEVEGVEQGASRGQQSSSAGGVAGGGSLTGAISLRPARGGKVPGVKPSLLAMPGSLTKARVTPTLSVDELMRWREACMDLRPASCIVHCIADTWDGELSVRPTPTASRTSLDRPPRVSKGDGSREPRASPSFAMRRSPKGVGRREEEMEPVAPLEVSSSSWVAQQRTWHEEQAASGKQESDQAVITRHIRSVLNKLTLERFAPLVQQLFSCGISTQEHLEILMHEIMEKATTQHHFISMYTELCGAVQEWSVQNQIGDNSRGGSFKRILLNECQNSFERYLKPPEHLQALKGEDRDEAEHKYKTAMIGNIRFVGALLAKNMVASSVIIHVTAELMANPSVPDALECLAAFLTTVGGMFDLKVDWKYSQQLAKVFIDVGRLSRDPAVPARIRCLLSDVLDLRKAGWQDQKMATKSATGPMTIDEVHTRAAQEDSRGGSRGNQSTRSTWSGGQQLPNGAGKSRNSSSSAGGAGGGAWTTVPSSGRGSRVLADQAVAGAQVLLRPCPSPAAGAAERFGPRPSPTNGRSSAVKPGPEAAPRRESASFRNSLRGTVKELGQSRDMMEALQRVKEMRIPPQQQSVELAHLLAAVADEGQREARVLGFRLAVRLIVEGVLSRSALQPGLENFAEKSKDLALDLPSLPRILSEECVPALEELVRAGILPAEKHQAFAQEVR